MIWFSDNREVERFNRTLQKVIQWSHAEEKDWMKEMGQFLIKYSTVTHTVTNAPPAQLMFLNTTRNDLPSIGYSNKPTKADKQVKNDHRKRKEKIAENANDKRKTKSVKVAGRDKVLLRNINRTKKLHIIRENQTYTILKVYPRSVNLQNDQTRAVHVRSKAHITMYHQLPHQPNAKTSSIKPTTSPSRHRK